MFWSLMHFLLVPSDGEPGLMSVVELSLAMGLAYSLPVKRLSA